MKTEKRIRFGCVADDFTGASDAASFLAKAGAETLLYNGIPDQGSEDFAADAVVIALKCRTQEPAGAVHDVIQAFRLLKERGARQFYYKYCSTFDSVREGNIGPVMDALLEAFDIPYTVLCPSLPVNHRIVKDGILLVDGQPLAETHMRNHPLTPMRMSRVRDLMEMQSRYPTFEWGLGQLCGERNGADKYMQELVKAHDRFYIVPDYYEQEHGYQIMEMFGDLPLLSGGSGLMEPIGNILAGGKGPDNMDSVFKSRPLPGHAILLAGSCSEMTRRQIDFFKKQGGAVYQLNPLQLLDGTQTISEIQDFLSGHKDQPVLIYSSAAPKEVERVKTMGVEGISMFLEVVMSEIAAHELEHGRTKFVIAGGETSGAVTKRLGFSSYRIGGSAAPGIPVMVPLQDERIRLVLKSGNFGQEDFFWNVSKEPLS